MNINYEIVGISDWFIDAIECYAAIHCKDIKVCVPQNIKEYSEAQRLLHLLEYVVPLQDNELPPTSVVREFLGGSSFKY